MVIDAALFSPQSRQRLFIVAHKGKLPPGLTPISPTPSIIPPGSAPPSTRCRTTTHMAWVWWRLPYPPKRNVDLAALLERNPPEDAWRSEAETCSTCST